MNRKSRAAFGRRRAAKHEVRAALRERVLQRIAASGSWKVPAVPALLDAYIVTCNELFSSAGRRFAPEEIEAARALVKEAVDSAFGASQRSKVAIRYHAEAAQPLGFEVNAEASGIAETYERWESAEDAPLFGAHADARVLSVAAELGAPNEVPVLDLGAGTGRNALALARRGHAVDAVELTPKFAQALAAEAEREKLPVRVVQSDIFAESAALERYRLVVASEVVPDFRGSADLRRLFELAARVLEDDGCLLVNLHLAAHGYTPERAAREFAEQCYSALFTANDVTRAAAGLGLACIQNDSAAEYERTHLPAEAWPPTPWFVNWSSGLDVYELERSESPVELRWLLFKKQPQEGLPVAAQRVRLPPPDFLREALLRRLKRRAVASGMWILPALPSMLDEYQALLLRCCAALAREFSAEQRESMRALLADALEQAYSGSQRSNIVLSFEAPVGTEITFTVVADAVPLPHAYAEWFEEAGESLFGERADARVLDVAQGFQSPRDARVLDLGAGLGRNALELARRGFRVDAVELTPLFAQRLEAQTRAENLRLRVFCANLLEPNAELGEDYAIVVASGVAGDFRDTAELRALFELSARCLKLGGKLVLSVHLTDESEPDAVAIQWGQQCGAMFFTRSELASAQAGLPFTLVSDHSAYDFEAEHLPEDAFPPTPAYPEWALGLHMYAVAREDSPLELRWLVFEKR
jgi:SAM-dependent methyltransferase